jgi:DNA-binding CsgD family transcriptional regulator
MTYPPSMDAGLDADDIRALFQLTGELRELGGDPAAWREHLAASLERVCGAQVVVVSELAVNPAVRGPKATPEEANCATAVTPLQIRDRGLEPAKRQSFFDDLYWSSHRIDDTLLPIIDLYGTAFTVRRSDIVDDRRWLRSLMANERYRRHGCGDFTMSMAPVEHLGVICGLEIYRAWGEPGFTPRDRLIVDLLHGELARDWRRAVEQVPRLTPRQRQVLSGLAGGESEKEVAARLGISAHTLHDHVKAVHRAYGVRSRGELLARWGTAMRRPRVRLVAEADRNA